MSSETSFINILPPTIINNSHEKVSADQLTAKELELLQSHRIEAETSKSRLARIPKDISLPVPLPRYPLSLTWSPDVLWFQLEEKPIIARLWVWNTCPKSIYVHCCNLWGDTARIGASWRCFPRTRFLLAPGLKAEVFIKATPRSASTIPSALCALQIAAQHLRDNVTGYFLIPIKVIFTTYIPPAVGEGG